MTDFRTSAIPPLSEPPPPVVSAPRGENFPVASRLLPRRVRQHVLAFYRFARLADDIADDPCLDPEAKTAWLGALERTLQTGHARQPLLAPAIDLRLSLGSSGVSDRHARQLLLAFRRDALGAHCRTWGELTAYCRLSAVPVGRYLLELHGENPEVCGNASDALCIALQVLNHVQDCRDDWVRLGRCYLPQVWFDDLGLSMERLVETACDPRMRAVLNRTLDQTDQLLVQAAALPGQLRNRRLALEAAVILVMAQQLSARLRRCDPLARRVRLGLAARLAAGLRGVWLAWRSA